MTAVTSAVNVKLECFFSLCEQLVNIAQTHLSQNKLFLMFLVNYSSTSESEAEEDVKEVDNHHTKTKQ